MRLAIPLCLLILFPAQTLALSLPQSDSRAGECEGLTKACTAAARELRAARDLIKGYEQHIAATDDRIEIARKEIETLKQLGALESERAKELENVIAAERDAKAALVKLKDEQSKRIVRLEKQLGRSRRLTLIAGVAAAVGILIAVGKN